MFQPYFQDPIEQFEKWFHEALEAKVLEPNAMNLATIKTITGLHRVLFY